MLDGLGEKTRKFAGRPGLVVGVDAEPVGVGFVGPGRVRVWIRLAERYFAQLGSSSCLGDSGTPLVSHQSQICRLFLQRY